MACLHDIYICSFLLAVISGHVFLFTDGRQIKPLKKQKPDYFEDDKGLGIHTKGSTGSKQIPTQNSGDHFSGAKEVFPPMSRNGPNPSPEFRTSLTKFTNGFQPTTPGKSPGIGHSYAESKEDNKQKSPSNKLNVVHSLQGDTNDFRPTGPGRSPGVGHSYRNTKVEPNVVHSLQGDSNGLRPTGPGRSPGVGHSYRNTKVEPNVVHSLQGDTNGLRPTGPGRSPGVGHSYRNTKVEPNVDSLQGDTNDLRPTGPGRSPGVGHSYRNTKVEPNA